MNDRSRISCVIPVFNGEVYLRECLDSVFAQTHLPDEVIVVDDGSTDSTPDLLTAYGHEIRTLRQARGGPMAARHAGIEAATGDWVALIDADDLWHPEKLARQLHRVRQNPAAVACVTMMQNFWVPEMQEEEERFRDRPMARPVVGSVSAMLVCRSTLRALLPVDEEILWMSQLRDGFDVEVVPEVLVYRRLHPNNFSRRSLTEERERLLRVLKRRLDHRRRGARPDASRRASNATK